MDPTRKHFDKSYYERNKERIREYQRISLRDPEKRKAQWLRVAKHRALRKGVPFNLKVSDLDWPTHCPILGIELNYGESKGCKGKDNSPSIDRLIPELGYIKSNCKIISSKANSMKYNATVDELKTFCTNVMKYINP